MKILLLGGSGRLGCAIQRQWRDHEILAPARQYIDVLKEKQIEKIINNFIPDLVINTSAYNNVDAAEGADHELCFKLNAKAPALIAQITNQKKIPFIHLSTDYVFEGSKREGYTEHDEPNPQSSYAKSKFDGERAVLLYNPKSYLIRTSRLFGPPATFSSSKPSFVELIIRDAQQTQIVQVNPTEVSSPTYVDDLANHIQANIFNFPEPGIYHMTNSGDATWFEWAQEIIKILNWPVIITTRDISTIKRAAKRPNFSVLISTKLPAMRPWQESLREYLTVKPPNFSPIWQL